MTIDRRTLLIAASAAGLAGGCARAEPSKAPPGSLQRIVDVTGAPALGGAVVTPEGLAFLEVAGRRNKDRPDTVTTEDRWHLGSNTKAMTAALYGKLVEDGRAKWGAALPELFPDLKLDPAWSRTTIEQVLSHRAGLSDKPVIGMSWLVKAQSDKAPMTVQRTALASQVLTVPPAGKPGQFEYANLNYILAGAAIERIAGEPWEAVITERLFNPLGMASAGFGAPKGAQPWGHRRMPLGVGGLIPIDPEGPADNPAAMGPAGTVHASLTDYAKFVRLFLTKGGGYLKPETIAHLTTPPPGGDYALGWGVVTDKPWAKGPRLGHEGSNTMWHAVTLVAPAREVAFITVSNAFPSNEIGAARTLVELLQKRFAPA